MKEVMVNRIMKVLPFIIAVLSVVIGVTITPLLVIAMINILFESAVAYGFKEWCAVLVLLLILKFEVSIKS